MPEIHNTNIVSKDAVEWVPYEGPDGGEGWRPAGSEDADDVEYQALPPGDVPEEVLEEAGVESVDALAEEIRDRVGDEQQTESQPDTDDSDGTEYAVSEGDPRREIDSIEEARQVISEFDETESEYDYWEMGEDFSEGSIIEVSTDSFQVLGDGESAVLVDPDDGVAVTESGDEISVDLDADYYTSREGETDGTMLGVWNDPSNRVANGDMEWSDFTDDAIPDDIPASVRGDDESSEQDRAENQTPDWVDTDPNPDEFREDDIDSLSGDELYLQGDEVVEFEPGESDGDIDTYEMSTMDMSPEFSVVDDVYSRVYPNTPEEGLNYIDTGEDSDIDIESGWYQVSDSVDLADDDSDRQYGYKLYDENGTEYEAEVIELQNSATFHVPIENTYNDPVEPAPEPSGEKDPETWTVEWESQDDSKTTPQLPMREKKLLMREWEAAIDNPEATESVRNIIRSVKDGTFKTEGQAYDKLIKEIMGAEGDPRENGFEDADEPTDAEIEAMELMQETSRKFFTERFGEREDVHRALAGFSHERLLPQLEELILGDESPAETTYELEDNPSGVWSTSKGAADSFTIAGGTRKSLVVSNEVTADDVFNMPDALYPYTEREETLGDDSDWDEGEINYPSHGIELEPEQVEIVNQKPTQLDGDTKHTAPLADVIDNPQSVIESGNPGAIAEFMTTLDAYATEEMRDAYIEQIESDESLQELDGWEIIEQEIQSYEETDLFTSADRPEPNMAKDRVVTIDVTSEEDSHWLHPEDNPTQDRIEMHKVSTSRKDDSEWIPYEGDLGGSGWQTVDGEQRVYDDKPPGDVPDEVLDEAGVDSVDELVEAIREETSETGQAETRPDWYEEDLAEFGRRDEMPDEGDYISIAGSIKTVSEATDNTIRTEADYRWADPEEYDVVDGVITESYNDATIGDNATNYLEFADEHELDDGWYSSVSTGRRTVEVESESGTVTEIDRTTADKVYLPVNSDPLTHSRGTPWEKYQGQEYPEDKQLADTLPLEDISVRDLSTEQVDAIANGLYQADEWGLIDDLDKMMGSSNMDAVAKYEPGLNTMIFSESNFTEDRYDEYGEDEYVGNSQIDTVFHESIHVKHTESMDDDPEIDWEDMLEDLTGRMDSGAREMAREFVSVYAGMNPAEVVAEVGTMIVRGEEVPEEAMYLYDKYHGPEL